jgi:NAD(P)-dependent dehydrogenase (short-subunit alcohol dehydrogenase family)
MWPHRGFSGRALGRHHRHQPDQRLPHHAPGPARHAAANWGRIINVASVHGLVASAQKSAYVAAKHGIVGLTKVTALENATTGVTCNAICPGWVLTPLVQKQVDAKAAALGITNEEAKRAAGRKRALDAVHHARRAGRAGGVLLLERRQQRARRGLEHGRRLAQTVPTRVSGWWSMTTPASATCCAAT